jgi:hypothetical protein
MESNTSNISASLYHMLSRKFPDIKLTDQEGQSTDDINAAITFEFPFVINGQVISDVSITLGDEGSLKLLGSNDVNDDRWFDLVRQLNTFAKANGLNWEPNIQGKDRLQRRDNKDANMEESSLYGSSKSSYQNMETTKLIIRHSKRIEESSPNSRTRNIQALYIQNESGERFRYPFPHLAGGRAMQRHVANGGNPYDHFGHYIISLSEQVYNYRRVNNLLARKSFMENSEISEIAEKSKKKIKDIKKVLERIQRQQGYLTVKENFTTFKKKEIDEETLNELRDTFTTQQFNEELVELFPYISDLIGEAKDDVPDEVFFKDPKNAPSADWMEKEKSAKAFPTRGDTAQKHGDLVSRIAAAVEKVPYVEVEPYSKDFIMKAIAITQKQIQQLEMKAQENPRDNQAKWGLEKATARMGILQKRLESADADGPERNSVAIEHLGKHIKNNDELSNLMLMASEEYNRMSPQDKKAMAEIFKAIVKKQKYVALFTNESIVYTDLEMTLGETTKPKSELHLEAIDPVIEFIRSLKHAIGEEKEDDDDSQDDSDEDTVSNDDETSAADDEQKDEEDMIKPRPSKAENTGDPRDVMEFVKSLYNADENSFPRGEEGVVISAVKEFGDEAEPIARKTIEALKAEGAERGIASPDHEMMRIKQLAGLGF